MHIIKQSLLSLVAVGALALAGCSTTGVKVDPAVISSFQPGVTTLTEVTTRLGPPSQTTTNSDGTTTLNYTFGSSQVSASTFIPVAGAFVGHTDSKTQYTQLLFDKNQRFVSSSVSEGQLRTGMGSSN